MEVREIPDQATLEAMTEEELLDRSHALTNARAAIKVEARTVAAEISRRAALRKFLEMGEEEQAAVRQALGVEGIPSAEAPGIPGATVEDVPADTPAEDVSADATTSANTEVDAAAGDPRNTTQAPEA